MGETRQGPRLYSERLLLRLRLTDAPDGGLGLTDDLDDFLQLALPLLPQQIEFHERQVFSAEPQNLFSVDGILQTKVALNSTTGTTVAV